MDMVQPIHEMIKEIDMSRNHRGLFGLMTVSGILGLSPTVHAENTAASPSENVLSEIVVTAEKRVEKLQDVPLAVTVVSSAQLANQHVYTIADLARTTPALEMMQAFGGPGGGGQIRGIGTQSFTRSAEGAVGIVVDGVPQGNVNTNNIFDMERVEVLRGPQGTLFGLTSSAGVINMVTVAPDPTKIEVKAHVDYSANGHVGSDFGRQTLHAVANVPLNSVSALRVSITGDRIDGVERNAFNHQDYVSKDYGIRARYRWNGLDNVDLNVIADFDRRTQNYSDPQFVYVYANPALAAELAACGITPSFANQSRCGSLPNDSAVKNSGVSAQLDVGIGDLTLTSITSLRKSQTGPADVDIQAVPSESVQIFTLQPTNSGRQFSQELRLTSPSRQLAEYVAGVFYSDYLAETGYGPGGVDNVGTFQAGPTFVPFAQDGTTTKTTNRSAAAFGQMTYHLTDSIGLIAGARYTHQRITDHASANPYDPTTSVTNGVTSVSNVSGRLGVQYKVNPDLTTYATAVRGYKGPQVIAATQGVPATVVAPEIPTAFEIGVKGALLNSSLAVDFNVFSTKVHDYQGQRCFIAPIGALTCIGESIPSVTTKGVELDLFGKPLKGLSLNGGFIYDRARYPQGWTGYDPNNLNGGTTDLAGKQLVGVPQTKLTFSGEYILPFGAIEGVVGADTVFKSAMRLGPTGDSRFVYPSHWTTGARIGIRSPHETWMIAVFARNLSNDHEPVTLFGGPSFTPPGADPTAPNGYVNGVSGWLSPESLREIGISFDVKY
jgi:iron complex outermembrane recepter protein